MTRNRSRAVAAGCPGNGCVPDDPTRRSESSEEHSEKKNLHRSCRCCRVSWMAGPAVTVVSRDGGKGCLNFSLSLSTSIFCSLIILEKAKKEKKRRAQWSRLGDRGKLGGMLYWLLRGPVSCCCAALSSLSSFLKEKRNWNGAAVWSIFGIIELIGSYFQYGALYSNCNSILFSAVHTSKLAPLPILLI